MSENNLSSGASVIREYLKTAPTAPGVYRMLSKHGDVLYVGKAKSIKKRIVSYTHVNRLPHRLQRMVASTVSMIFVTTRTESEALNARLILILANHIGDHAVLSQALHAALPPTKRAPT